MPNRMQSEFIDSLKALIAKGEKKALLISATGTGKTYASAFAVRELKAKKALFIVHREQIAKQAMKSYDIVFNNTKTTALLSGTQKMSIMQTLSLQPCRQFAKKSTCTSLGKMNLMSL